jgi:hypothetical protein
VARGDDDLESDGVPVDVIEASTPRPDDQGILADVVALESA